MYDQSCCHSGQASITNVIHTQTRQTVEVEPSESILAGYARFIAQAASNREARRFPQHCVRYRLKLVQQVWDSWRHHSSLYHRLWPCGPHCGSIRSKGFAQLSQGFAQLSQGFALFYLRAGWPRYRSWWPADHHNRCQKLSWLS